jgi:hypothetical protein
MKSITDTLFKFYEFTIPNPNYRVAATLLIGIIAILGVALLYPKFRRQRANLVLGITLITLFLIMLAVTVANRGQWILGLLPTLLVAYQLFFLWLYHPRETDSGQAAGISANFESQAVAQKSYDRAKLSVASHFSLRTLFVRYGLPAVLLGITGVVLADIIVNPDWFFSAATRFTKHANTLLQGVRLGAAGAYVYILLELGRRTFRHDVTGAAAMWCWVTLVLGPMLAATVAFLWLGQGDATPTNLWWGTGIILFFTGFAPRRVVAAIAGAASQLMKIDTPVVVQNRLIPLSQIRGIGPQIEERLGEEGITDVNSLAAAEPVRLVRNTSFDMRLILSWVDEAILIVTLPRSWGALEDEGITGAIDLAWYYDRIIDPATHLPRPVPAPEIVNLAAKAKLDVDSLVATIQRLWQDTQVQYIWALYNNFTEFSGGEPAGARDDRDEDRREGLLQTSSVTP